MLAKRIIPTILTRGRTLVKGIAFDSWRSVGVTAQAVRIHSMRGVDELVLLDIAATSEHRGPDLTLIRELAEVCFMPLTVGGGIRTIKDATDVLRAGADKVVVRTAGPSAANKIANALGCQAVVAAIDVTSLDYAAAPASKALQAVTVAKAKEWEQAGAGEIMLTRCEREGTMMGYDLDLLRAVAQAVSIPVIANGGAGTYEHMAQAIEAGADAVAAGAMFQFSDCTPKGAAKYLQERGIEVRT